MRTMKSDKLFPVVSGAERDTVPIGPDAVPVRHAWMIVPDQPVEDRNLRDRLVQQVRRPAQGPPRPAPERSRRRAWRRGGRASFLPQEPRPRHRRRVGGIARSAAAGGAATSRPRRRQLHEESVAVPDRVGREDVRFPSPSRPGRCGEEEPSRFCSLACPPRGHI